jgi:protein gp37
VWGPAKTTNRRLFGDGHWREPVGWNAAARREGSRKRVFCASMSDVFEDHPQVTTPRSRLFQLIDETESLDWLILTKRPENIGAFVPPAWLERPRSNVWFGTSVEDQRRADERIPILAKVPAAVRFLSCEPLLGPIPDLDLSAIDWVIVGGESGPGARRMDVAWARSLRDQAKRTRTSFFFKQTGTVLASELGAYGKGHDLPALPIDLRIREFPVTTRYLSGYLGESETVLAS